MLSFVALLYGIELVNDLDPAAHLTDYGILPRRVDGLDGVLWAPLLHANWPHLMANTVPILVLGWLAMSGGVKQFLGVTAMIWLIGGLGTWLVGAESYHIGASGLAFGWMVFLLARGFFNGSMAQIWVALVLFFYWGGMLMGVLPGQQGISWEGHLFGALAGLLAAWLVSRSGSSPLRRSPTGTLRL